MGGSWRPVEASSNHGFVVDHGELVIELLTLSSHRCRETSRHLALILESLDALSNSDDSRLKQCCKELDKSYGPCLSNSAEQLKHLAAKLQQARPET